jgi:hypothetical protein
LIQVVAGIKADLFYRPKQTGKQTVRTTGKEGIGFHTA